jgi:hypothetical protein
MLRRIPLHAIRIDRGPRYPSFASPAGLEPVETAINQNPREPYLKRQVFAERAHVRIGLHEGVLYGLVGVRCISQVMERNASGAALMALDKGRICFAGLVQLTGGLEGFHADGNGGIGFTAGF